ncbi:MAG: hypothetical protein JKX91_12030, partial [Rhizobiaceae bacterium]|nr:hypothetical protein [Rhizobiaceae bacterium]
IETNFRAANIIIGVDTHKSTHVAVAINEQGARLAAIADRSIGTDSLSAIKTYEVKLDKLESQKALINENLAKKPDLNQDFDQSFRTALAFLANPWNL